MDQDRAEVIALNGLFFIAGDEKYLEPYLNLSGLDIKQLKENASNPDTAPNILASIIDFLLQNEKILIDFSTINYLDPRDIQKTRQYFPGASQDFYE